MIWGGPLNLNVTSVTYGLKNLVYVKKINILYEIPPCGTILRMRYLKIGQANGKWFQGSKKYSSFSPVNAQSISY